MRFQHAYFVLALAACLLAMAPARLAAEPGWLGVTVSDITPEEAAQLGWPAPRGAKIIELAGNGAGAAAGLAPGDIIVAIDDRGVSGRQALADLVASRSAGTVVEVGLVRAAREYVVAVTLGERPSPAAILAELEERASADDIEAIYKLGAKLEEGDGVQQDYELARRWYERGAAREDPRAMFRLGLLYAKGRGVRQDFEEARRWYERAVARGSAAAMVNLGVLYYEGNGVRRDHAKARKLWQDAAALGDETAARNLRSLEEEPRRARGRSPAAPQGAPPYYHAPMRGPGYCADKPPGSPGC